MLHEKMCYCNNEYFVAPSRMDSLLSLLDFGMACASLASPVVGFKTKQILKCVGQVGFDTSGQRQVVEVGAFFTSYIVAEAFVF